MKNALTYRIISFLLGVFIFISSAGISMDIHYCGDEVYDFSVIGKVKTCSKTPESNNDLMTFKKKNCCSSDHLKVETSDDYRFSKSDSDVFVAFDLTYIHVISLSIVENSKSVYLDRVLPPPPEIKNRDIYLKVESFLI